MAGLARICATVFGKRRVQFVSNSRISHIRLRRKRNRPFIAPVGVTFMGEVIAVVWAD